MVKCQTYFFSDNTHRNSFTKQYVHPQVEYDLAGSSENDLKVRTIERIEQSATPTAFIWYPPLSAESFILLSNDEVSIL